MKARLAPLDRALRVALLAASLGGCNVMPGFESPPPERPKSGERRIRVADLVAAYRADVRSADAAWGAGRKHGSFVVLGPFINFEPLGGICLEVGDEGASVFYGCRSPTVTIWSMPGLNVLPATPRGTELMVRTSGVASPVGDPRRLELRDCAIVVP